MMSFSKLAATFVLIAMAGAAAATEYKIGTYGSSVELDASWQRQRLNPDLGPDQFIHEDGFYFLVLEDQALLDRRSDYITKIETFLVGLQTRVKAVDLDPEVRFERVARVGYLTRRLSAEVSNVKVAYRLDLVGRDGLSYLVMTWAEASKSLEVQEVAEQVSRSLVFPGSETEWGKAAEPTTHTFPIGDWRLQVDYRDSVFTGFDDETSGIFTLTTTEEDVAVHIILELFDDGLEAALDDVIRLVSEDDEFDELERIDLEHEAGVGRQALLRHRSERASYDLSLALIEVKEGYYADLRMVSSGDDGHRERMWNELLQSLRVIAPPEVDAFPVVEVAKESKVDLLNPSARELLEGCSVIGSISGWFRQLIYDRDGSVLALESRQLLRLQEGVDEEVLYSSEAWLSSWRVAAWANDVWLLNPDGSGVSKVVNHGLEPAGFGGRLFASVGDELVVVRSDDSSGMLGFENLVNPKPTTLIRRTTAGDETELAEVAGSTVENLVSSLQGEKILLVVRERRLLDGSSLGQASELLEIEMSTHRKTSLGTWAQISRVAAGDEGWLVSGTPEAGLQGLYLVPRSGQPELLISGNMSGLRLFEGELVFTADVCIADEGESENTCIYRGPLELIREFGPAFRPLTTDTMNRIASELTLPDGESGLVRSIPTTEAEIRSFVSEARTVSTRLAGIPLPTKARAVDRLLRDMMGQESLSDQAITLLALLMVDSLLDDGAIWVEAPLAITSARINGVGLVGENEYAMALNPVQVMISTLYQEEGWWDPVTSVPDQAEGRALLFGHDREALEAELEARDDRRVEQLLENGKIGKLKKLLDQHRDNIYLRSRVYGYLASTEDIEGLSRLSSHFAALPESSVEDWRAWLAVRLHQKPTGRELDELVSDLHQAISDYPESAALYLILGSVYESTTAEDRFDLARACYIKVSEIYAWGEVASSAESAIERLDEAL